MSKKKTLYREAKGAGSATGKAVGKGAKKSYRYISGGFSYAAKKVNPMQTWPNRKAGNKPQKKKSKK